MDSFLEDLTWPDIVVLVAWTLVIFRLGVGWGRLSSESDRIKPISTTRISPEAMAKIHDALRRGKKIEAIKILREDAGCGLAEAKKTVEGLQP